MLTEVAVDLSVVTHAPANDEIDVVEEDDRGGQGGSVVVLLDEDVTLEEPVLIRVGLDLVESVAETESKLFYHISKQHFLYFLN